MSRENLQIVRNAFDAYNAGGLDGLLMVCPPDVVWRPMSEWVEDSLYSGHDGMRRLFDWLEQLEDRSAEIQEIREVDGRVLVRAELTGQTSTAGMPVRQEWVAVCSGFHEGMIGEWSLFRNWQEALQACGGVFPR